MSTEGHVFRVSPQTPRNLGYYSVRRSYKVAEELIRRGSPVNQRDADGLTPFLLASSSGRVDLIELLAQNGADVKIRDGYNRSAKEIAVFHRQGEVLESPRFREMK